jgi:hypothetical protein
LSERQELREQARELKEHGTPEEKRRFREQLREKMQRSRDKE